MFSRNSGLTSSTTFSAAATPSANANSARSRTSPLLLHPCVQNADIVQVPVFLGVVEPISHHELIGNLKPDIAHWHRPHASLRFVEQRRDPQRLRLPLFEHLHQIVQCNTAVDDIF